MQNSETVTNVQELFESILANQLSQHDDIEAVVNRLTDLENSIVSYNQTAPDSPAVNEAELYLAGRALSVELGRCSTSILQRVLRLGYSKAANLIDLLEEKGVVGPADGSKPREILISVSDLEELEEAEAEVQEDESYETDELYEEAKQIIISEGKASTSYLQRKLRIGYSRAARLIDLLEEGGVIGPADGSKARELLLDKETKTKDF